MHSLIVHRLAPQIEDKEKLKATIVKNFLPELKQNINLIIGNISFKRIDMLENLFESEQSSNMACIKQLAAVWFMEITMTEISL